MFQTAGSVSADCAGPVRKHMVVCNEDGRVIVMGQPRTSPCYAGVWVGGNFTRTAKKTSQLGGKILVQIRILLFCRCSFFYCCSVLIKKLCPLNPL